MVIFNILKFYVMFTHSIYVLCGLQKKKQLFLFARPVIICVISVIDTATPNKYCPYASHFPSQYHFIGAPHLHSYVSVIRRRNGRRLRTFTATLFRKKSILVFNFKESFFFPLFRKFFTCLHRKHVNCFRFAFLL